MAERVPKGVSLHFFTDETGRFRTQSKTNTNLRGVGIGATAALIAVGGYFAFKYGFGMEGDDFDYVSERQVPEPIRSPDDPYVDINGRPILYPLKPSGVSEYDTTMIEADGSNIPPKNSPDALLLRKENPIKYAELYYGGASRTEIAEADSRLYKRLLALERELGYEIMLRQHPYGQNPLLRYELLYKGMTRGELYTTDPKYYNYLRYHGLLESVPFAPPPYGDDPIRYCNEKWPGLTRGKLQEVDPNLYEYLRRTIGADGRPLIEQIDVQLPGEHDPYKYYLEHHPNLNQEQLKAVDPKTYWQLRRWGLIHLVPK